MIVRLFLCKNESYQKYKHTQKEEGKTEAGTYYNIMKE